MDSMSRVAMLQATPDELTQMQRERDNLAAEVRRLRAMLEPTPDARELAEEIVDYVSEEEYGAIAFATKQIAAHDARLLDEAAERGVAWLKTLHHEPEEGLPWSGKIRRMQDLQVRTLRAAIKGVK